MPDAVTHPARPTPAGAIPPARGASPAMVQWFAAKAQYPDALLFYRMGDFYELFFADAEAAAATLDIVLSHRGEHDGVPIPMCGVPAHAAEAYLARLIRRGFRVAVAEQMEQAKQRTGKGPIPREVVRLVTPGTLTEDALLEPGRRNLLLVLAVAPRPDPAALGAAWVDVSTGLFETQALAEADLPALLARLDPAEVLAPLALPLGEREGRRAPEQLASPPGQARTRVAEAFGAASLEAFGSFGDAEAMAAAMLLDYVRATQGGKLPLLSPPARQGDTRRLEMDAATRTSLEIVRARDGGTGLTLLAAVQRTLTSAGARLLADWLGAPLTDLAAIAARQDAWSWFLTHPGAATQVRAALRGVPDMARALGRLSLGRGGPRDLAAVRDGLLAASRVAEALAAAGDDPGAAAAELRARLPGLAPLADLLRRALSDPAPLRLDDGAVAAGFDAELDAERALRDDSRRVIASLQLGFAQRFGVASLKIRLHSQLGYVIEVPSAFVEKLRAFPDLTLRQGMANGARFSCQELAELDRRISEASERASSRERLVFASLAEAARDQADALAACTAALAAIDVAQSAAALAAPGTWCRPVLHANEAFHARQLRHPVVEGALPDGAAFVPNDCDLSGPRRLMLLTGPNMAGKSTFLRQNALAVVLAQAGLPVPAAAAEIGVADRLFCRVGASDDLARGRSTFMVEMTETASILHQAGPRSFVVVDEIGRGTSTHDGLAIAWAVLESLHNVQRCRTLYATHFHELAGLAAELPRLRPHTMRVKEWGRQVVFLHEVAEGSAGRSWGVHVARLAGVPAPVTQRAADILARLLARADRMTDAAALPLFAHAGTPAPQPGPDRVSQALADIDPDRLSPREALDALYGLKRLVQLHDAAQEQAVR